MSSRSTETDRFLVFVPMYNCAPQIGRVIAQFEQLAHVPGEVAVVCIDNRSTDETLQAAEHALATSPIADKYLLRNDDNYGLGGSHKVAFEFAKTHDFDYVIVLHGDDQGSIADLIPQLADGRHRDHEALLGARFMKGATLAGYSPLRTWANRAFNLIFSGVGTRRLYDLGSGLNLFRRAYFDDGFHLRFADNLTFNYYLVLALADRKARFGFFPINWREDDQVSNAKLFSQGLQMLRLLSSRLMSKRDFYNADHREQRRDGYPATIIRQWPAP